MPIPAHPTRVLLLWRQTATCLAVVVLCALSARQAQAAHPVLDQANALIENEQFPDAFGKVATLLPTLPPGDANLFAAHFTMGKILMGLGLYQSALRSFDEVAVGPGHALYNVKMRAYLDIQHHLPGNLATVERLSEAKESAFKREDLPEIRYLLGRYHFDASEHKKALTDLKKVTPQGGEFYLKSRILMGITYVIGNSARPALEAFKDVLRYADRVGRPDYYAPYEQKALMALGRLFFSIRKYETAGRYYDRVREGTTPWLDSLFELGWTYFHLRRLDRVLGQLHTLNSPYFEDRYYPEARVLEALILFRTCRFPETLVVVQRFLRDYKPLRKELDNQLGGSRSDAEFYWYLASLAADKEGLSVALRRIFNAALNDHELQRVFTLVAKLGAEQAGLAKLKRNTSAPKAAQLLVDDLGRVRNVMISEAGAMARRRLTQVRSELTEIIRQGLRIKYETLKARRNSINDEVRVSMAKTAAAASEPRAKDDEHVVWPFDGGYWRDELGGYTYDIRSRCQKKHFPPGWKPKAGAPRKASPKPVKSAKKAAASPASATSKAPGSKPAGGK
ncbi:MAG: hypothetical protein KC502_00630 [Myxococcales bacterium]|nr:hypothetical protein [Myxococcales bacterium]